MAWGMKQVPERMSMNPALYLRAMLNPFVAMGVVALILALLTRMALFSLADLSFVLPVTAVGYVIAVFLGKVFLHETVTPPALAGDAADLCRRRIGRIHFAQHHAAVGGHEMKWVLVAAMVFATVLGDLLQSHEMKRAGEQSVSARGFARLLHIIAQRRLLILGIACNAVSFFSFMALVQTEPLSLPCRPVNGFSSQLSLSCSRSPLLLRRSSRLRRQRMRTHPSPAVTDELIHKQFGDNCSLLPGPPQFVADMDDDGVDDLVVAAKCKNPMADRDEYSFVVSDPYDTFLGYTDVKVTSTFASDEPDRRGICLLIIHGAEKDAWRAEKPKAKFLLINLPFKTLTVKRLTQKKKTHPRHLYGRTGRGRRHVVGHLLGREEI